MNEKDALILLDLVLVYMTVGWMLVALWKGVNDIELLYNYTYMLIMFFGMILNIRILYKIRK